MKDIKDYLHLYLGCECVNSWFLETHEEYNNGWTLIGIESKYKAKPYHIENSDSETHTSDIKLILRHLSDMTVEEDRECHNIMFGEYFEKFKAKGIIHFEAEKIKYLLSRGFDLFGLIEEKLALDKTKLK